MTKQVTNIDYAFQPGPAFLLTEQRIAARLKLGHRITYDCMNAGVTGSNRVKCMTGHKFKRHDGCMALLSVLAGRTSGICQKCPDYDGEIAE